MKDGKVIATAYSQCGLYELTFEVNGHAENVCHVNKAELWNKRYGHAGSKQSREPFN